MVTVFGALACALGAYAVPSSAEAALTLTAGNNATTTPSVATSITGFQIVGPAASTTPVKIHVTSGTVHVSAVEGVTMSGNGTATLNLSGAVADLNAALSSLTYTRSSTGTDTLEVALVNSSQIFFPDNGHVYQYVASSLTWNAAKTAAEALSAYGATGYLVTITSLAENNFVKARLSGDAWIGASDSENEGDWKWVTGPEEERISFWPGTGTYSSWAGGEPNDSDSNEDCGEEYVSSGSWNDLPCSGTTISGYVAEFGSDDEPATVVSKDVSIVTANVPAVTSLSPATGSATALTTADLVIGFSKSVSADTGNILVKKSSDDSLVESIAVGGEQVTGGGTSSITVDPAAALEEGVQYYVIVPSTAFKDGSGNHFDGIAATTTWTFSIADHTAPSITALAASPATTTAAVSWTTNEAASTRAAYSTGTSYASTTSETDTGSRVTSHAVSLSGLASCTTYNYEAVSADAAGNHATSTSASFTTLGCLGAPPTSTTATSVPASSAATTTLSDSGRTLTVATPANFTATSSSVVIQIKAQEATPVLGAIGAPSASVSSAASVVFEVTALIDGTTVLDSFDHPVTISYAYTDEDVAGLDESTLAMYHYHAGAWERLDECSVDAAANVITCDAPSFSTFAIFGSAPASGGTSSRSHASGGSIQGQVANLVAMGNIAAAEALKAEWPQLFNAPAAGAAASGAPAGMAVRDLELGMTGDDVLALQKLLNAAGFTLAANGAGAPGGETTYFGALTKTALAKYQAAASVAPAAGYFGPLTRAQMKAAGRAGIWW
jgi:peptidoglycan hydrolase-like protein with peptidoglycan-binding domain